MKNEKPLVKALNDFVNNQPISLHVPGHKNGFVSNLPDQLKQALQYDVTELTGLDDFHHPEEAIKEAEQLLANAYNSDQSFFLVNGSTVGNLAMIYAVCEMGDTVLVQRNAHKSIFHALELVGANCVYLAPEWDQLSETAGHIATTTLSEALKLYKDVKAVIFTYPTYYGVTSNQLEEQIALCHLHQIPVLIDEAHGAHFQASESFPKSALQLGADVVVQSAHKTLPAMTMGSFLHVKSAIVKPESINHYLRMLQSSSPSYLIMASLDDARHYVANYLESDTNYLLEKRAQFIISLKLIKHLEVVEVDDPLKLLLRTAHYNGFELKEALEAQQLFVELADTKQVLLILPLLKQRASYPFTIIKTKIKAAMTELYTKERTIVKQAYNYEEPIKVSATKLAAKQVTKAQKEWVHYTKAIGKVAAEMIIPYPPGIPLVLKGEKITVSKMAQLTDLLALGADFQGTHQLDQNRISVIKE